MKDTIKVMIVEDDRDFLFLVKNLLEDETDIVVVGTACTREKAVIMAAEEAPDIVIMDLYLTGDADGIEAARQIRLRTDAKIIILTAQEEPELVIQASRRSFASGYIFKRHYHMLAETVRETAGGHTPQEYMIRSAILNELTPAERCVFEDMIGNSVKLNSSEKTINNQKTKIYQKLGVKNRRDILHLFGE